MCCKEVSKAVMKVDYNHQRPRAFKLENNSLMFSTWFLTVEYTTEMQKWQHKPWIMSTIWSMLFNLFESLVDTVLNHLTDHYHEPRNMVICGAVVELYPSYMPRIDTVNCLVHHNFTQCISRHYLKCDNLLCLCTLAFMQLIQNNVLIKFSWGFCIRHSI